MSHVLQLIEFLSKEENLVQEGIFRRSGKVTRQQELKTQLSRGAALELDGGPYSVHDCASVLKSFLAELPEPLLMEAYYHAYCQIAELCQTECSSGRVLHAVQLVLLLLPKENRQLLKELLRLLSLTASLAHSNRMSAENLATLFTPHLLCPRKLSPEEFHINSQNFTCVVVFMIKEGLEIFEVPQTLATDIKAYWDRRRLTPNHLLERSLSEGSSSTAKTVFTFVDRERTAQEHSDNPTETALAQLYAHIQALPESNKKKRLIKQFNKENGHGTPRTKTLSDSIKKHIFHKTQKGKVFTDTGQFKLFASSGDSAFNSPQVCKTPMSNLWLNERREEWRLGGRRPVPVMKASLCGAGASPMPPPDPQAQGSNGDSEEQEAGGGIVGFKPVPVGHCQLDIETAFLGRNSYRNRVHQKAFGDLHVSGKWRSGFRSERRLSHGRIRGRGSRQGVITDESIQGLPVQSKCSDSQPCRLELLQSGRGFRPVVIRRQAAKRIATVLPRHGHQPSILIEPPPTSVFRSEFWVSPGEEAPLGSRPGLLHPATQQETLFRS